VGDDGGVRTSFECQRWLNGCAAPCPPKADLPLPALSPSLHWRLKKRIYSRAQITLIVASEWMRERVRKYTPGTLSLHRIRSDRFAVFRPRSKEEARSRFGIPSITGSSPFRAVGLATDRFQGDAMVDGGLKAYQTA